MGGGAPEPQKRNMEQQIYASAANQMYLGLPHVKRHVEATTVLARNSLGLQIDATKGGLFDWFLRCALHPWIRGVRDGFRAMVFRSRFGTRRYLALGPFGEKLSNTVDNPTRVCSGDGDM